MQNKKRSIKDDNINRRNGKETSPGFIDAKGNVCFPMETIWAFDKTGILQAAQTKQMNYIIYKITEDKLYKLYCAFCSASRVIPLPRPYVLWFYDQFYRRKNNEYWGLREV